MVMRHVKPSQGLLWAGIAINGIVLGYPCTAQAQSIVPNSIVPNSDGTGTQVLPSDNQYTISGGSTSTDGQNLFHSFAAFGLSANEVANFLTTPEVLNVLARVNGGDASVINGLLQITGSQANLYLLNPNGVLFGTDARLNLSGNFTATTADGVGFGEGTFSALESNNYAQLIGAPNTLQFSLANPGAVVNAGDLQLGTGQRLMLAGGTVVNTGTVQTAGGEVAIAAVPGQHLIRLSPTGSLLSYEINPNGAPNAITALSLPALLTGNSAVHPLTVNPDGSLQLAQMAIPTNRGTVIVSGGIDTSNPNGAGGTLFLLGDQVAVVAAELTATGNTGGGSLYIGGNYTGTGPLPNAQVTFVSADSTLNASATGTGNGGEVIIWSDQTTRSYGQIAARGGAFGGNGGLVETSSRGFLAVGPNPDISAIAGSAGTWLIDPFDIVIDNFGGDSNGFVGGNPFIASSAPARLDINTLADAIEAGGTIIVSTGTGGAQVGNITLNDDLFYNPEDDDTTLTLQAAGSIFLNGRILPDDTVTNLNINLLADTDNTGNGQVVIDVPGIEFAETVLSTNGGNLVIQANSTNLTGVSDASAIIVIADNGIDSQGGNITLNGDSTNGDGVQIDGFISTIDFSLGGSGELNISGNTNNTSTFGVHFTNNAGVNVGPLTIEGNNLTGATGIRIEPILDLFEATSDVTLTSDSDIHISALRTPGNIEATAGGFFRADSVIDGPEGGPPIGSVISDSGQVTIRHAGNEIVPFIVGDATINGTLGQILANIDSIAPTATFFPSFIQGDIAILTGSPPPPPPPPNTPEIPSIPDCLADCTVTRPDPPGPEVDVFDGDPDSPLDIADNPNNPNPGFELIDENYADEFTEHLGLDGDALPRPELPKVQADLAQVAEASGIRPAIIYVSFIPPSAEDLPSDAPKADAPKADAPKAKALNRREIPDDYLLELILVTPSGPPIRKTVSATHAQVITAANSLRTEVTNRSRLRGTTYLASAQQLYQWIVAPLESELTAQEIGNLAFVMAPGLRSLPVSALHDSNGFLIERFSVGLMPSISLTDLRYVDVRDTEVLAMGASDFQDQPELPAVPLELTTIAELLWPGDFLLNETFTAELLLQSRALKPYGIVHLATHGDFQPGNIANSYIQFWNERLSMDQIRALQLNNPPVQLMVLSACRTALGDEEAELGFAGLAVQAGVKTALASLWKVDDVGTAGLMSQFYTSLRQEPIKAEALRQAQLAMLKGEIRLEGNQLVWSGGSLPLPPELRNTVASDTFVHPYFWAAFTTIGSPW
jgi:filamentous hemagglutinin family protein